MAFKRDEVKGCQASQMHAPPPPGRAPGASRGAPSPLPGHDASPRPAPTRSLPLAPGGQRPGRARARLPRRLPPASPAGRRGRGGRAGPCRAEPGEGAGAPGGREAGREAPLPAGPGPALGGVGTGGRGGGGGGGRALAREGGREDGRGRGRGRRRAGALSPAAARHTTIAEHSVSSGDLLCTQLATRLKAAHE